MKSRFATIAGILRSAVGALIVAAGVSGPHAVSSLSAAPTPSPGFVLAEWTSAKLGTMDPHVFQLALGAAACAVRSGKISSPSTLTVIDYSRPSTQKRLWVVDLRAQTLLFEELVAHGQGSGNNMATLFSNDAETHRSSLGLFEAKESYIGKNGYSLRLEGLDHGFNDHAMDRAIVMHGAAYVNEAIARTQGRLGRSWGCPAVREAVAHELIDRIQRTGLIFAYYPDPNWLSSSEFLSGNCYGSTPVPVVAAG